MHRESEKHSPVREDHPRKESESLIRGGGATRTEGDGSGGRSTPPEHPGAPRGMSPADVARRAELTRHLPPSEFPADRGRLLAHLRTRRAPDSVVDAISGLPEGREFQSLGEVVRAIGVRTEH
jgi:hypothetical protein